MHKAVRAFKTTIVEARFASLIVSLCVIAMRYGLFVRHGIPERGFPDTGYIWQYIAHWFENPWISLASSTVSVFITAWLLSLINNRFSLIRTRTNLPFIVPLILFSLHPYLLGMSPDYVSVILVLYAFVPLLNSYQKSNTQLFSFRTSVIIGIAALFQVYALFMLPLWWRGEYSMRGGHFKSFLSSVFGVLLVFWSVFTVYFFFDNTDGFVAPFLHFYNVSILQLPLFTPVQWAGIIFVFLLFVLFMIFSIKTYIRDKVITLVTIQFMVFLLVFLLIFEVVYWSSTLFFFLLAMTFLSYLMAYFYTMTANKFHIYGAYLLLGLCVIFYLIHYFSFLA